jgi:hypothetical protein
MLRVVDDSILVFLPVYVPVCPTACRALLHRCSGRVNEEGRVASNRHLGVAARVCRHGPDQGWSFSERLGSVLTC